MRPIPAHVWLGQVPLSQHGESVAWGIHGTDGQLPVSSKREQWRVIVKCAAPILLPAHLLQKLIRDRLGGRYVVVQSWLAIPPEHLHTDGGFNSILDQLRQHFQCRFDMGGVVMLFSQIDNVLQFQVLDQIGERDDLAGSRVENLPGMPFSPRLEPGPPTRSIAQPIGNTSRKTRRPRVTKAFMRPLLSHRSGANKRLDLEV